MVTLHIFVSRFKLIFRIWLYVTYFPHVLLTILKCAWNASFELTLFQCAWNASFEHAKSTLRSILHVFSAHIIGVLEAHYVSCFVLFVNIGGVLEAPIVSCFFSFVNIGVLEAPFGLFT